MKQSIIDRVKTFEDALALADEQTREEYLKSVKGYNTKDEIAYKKLKLIAKVVNEGTNEIQTLPNHLTPNWV